MNNLEQILDGNEKFRALDNLPLNILNENPPDSTVKNTENITNDDIQKCLDYKRKFRSVYSDRRELPLICTDETGLQHPINSMIIPTPSGPLGLHTYSDAASFVSTSCAYRQLDPPFDFPLVARSPNFTLTQRAGNSLDLSLVLCSMLIGCGYDALILIGYASKPTSEGIYLNIDYEHVDNLLKEFNNSSPFEARAGSEKVETIPTKYSRAKTHPLILETSLPISQAEQNIDEKLIKPSSPAEDELHGLRVHHWILVRSGSMDILETFFIEPSTGAIIHADNPNYLGIELAFNHENIWINMQPCINGVKDISYNLLETASWDPVFSSSYHFQQPKYPKLKFDVVSGKCHKIQAYHNAKVEFLSRQNDGLTRRVTLLKSAAQNVIMEWFTGRADKLIRRKRTEGQYIEYFDKGRTFQHLVFQDEKLDKAGFNAESRLDGLEYFQRYSHGILKFMFEDREDGLTERSVTVDEGSNIREIQDVIDNQTVGVQEENNHISKAIYDLEKDLMKMVISPRGNSLLPIICVFKKVSESKKSFLERVKVETSDPHYHVKPFVDETIVQMYDWLLIHEEKAVQETKGLLRELESVTNTRIQEEESLSLSFKGNSSADETKANVQMDSSQSSEIPQTTAIKATSNATPIDYLGTYLAVNVPDLNLMDRQIAMKAREASLNAMKERLLLQAQIIQTRFETERMNLKRYEGLSEEEKRQFKSEIDDVKLKIKILEKRIETHKEKATDEYLKLDTKLREDPRISPFLDSNQ